MSDFPLVLSLDVAGNPHKWITVEDACYYYAKDLIAWQMGEDDSLLRGGIQRITGLQSKLDINSIIAVKGMTISKIKGYKVPPLTNKALFRRDHNICAYCGHEFPTSKLTRDHIHARSRGGPDRWENVVTSCGPCNKVKDNKTLKEFGNPLMYVPYAPNRSEFLILMNRNIRADQMEFLKKKCPQHSRVHGTK